MITFEEYCKTRPFRLEVVKLIRQNIIDKLEGPLEEAVSNLKKLKEQYPGRQLYLDFEEYWDGDRWDGKYRWGLALKEKREETDEEYTNRLRLEYKNIRRQEQIDRETYERLAKQFKDKP